MTQDSAFSTEKEAFPEMKVETTAMPDGRVLLYYRFEKEEGTD